MTTRGTVLHGTHGGYLAHLKRSEKACQRCKDAQAAYMRNYRAGDAERRRKDRWWNNTAEAARVLLAAEYPERFAEILAEIRAEKLNEI